MAASDMSGVSEDVRKIIASLEFLSPQQKKEYVLKIIDIAESNSKLHKLGTIILAQIDTIKRNVLRAGIVEVSLRDFGKLEIFNLFQILMEADAAQQKKNRRIVFYALIAGYFGIAFLFFFSNLNSVSIKPFIRTNLMTITAWIVVSLLNTTGYFLVNNICEITFKSLNKYTFKLIFNKYSVSYILSLLVPYLYFLWATPLLTSKFIAPYLYPFVIRTIEGILVFNFGSLLTSIGGTITYILATLTSIFTLWKFISDILQNRKDNKQRSVFSEINDVT